MESEVMVSLMERLEENPNNEVLKKEIRHLDLMARKAFFNNQWQINTGSLLLLICAIIFGISLKIWHAIHFSIEMPEPNQIIDLKVRILAQRGIIIGGLILVFMSLGASYFTRDHLKSFKPDTSVQAEEALGEKIEIVNIYAATEENTSLDTSPPEVITETSTLPSTPEADQPESPSERAYPALSAIQAQHASFRGSPLANGVSPHKNLPVTWDPATGTHIIWKVSLKKKGNNSPVIWGDRLFLAVADASGKEILCYDRHSGTLLWKKEVKNVTGSPGQFPKVTDDTGLSAPTLATDGLGVYAIFADGDIICVDMSGKEIWSRNLGLPDNHYGHSSSLLYWQKKLMVQYDTNRGGKVMALDCFTGNTIWETDRNAKISWASPILASVGGRFQLILSADPIVAGYDPDSGRELWSVDCMMGEVGPSPAFGSGLVFAANEYAKLVAIRPGPPSATVVWEADEYLPEVASPVAADGLLFIATSYGVLAVFDTKTGEKYWEHESRSGFYASPLVADGKLFALDMEGVMHIFQISKEKILISEPELGEKTVATPAFASGRIYLRGEENLYCIGN